MGKFSSCSRLSAQICQGCLLQLVGSSYTANQVLGAEHPLRFHYLALRETLVLMCSIAIKADWSTSGATVETPLLVVKTGTSVCLVLDLDPMHKSQC